MVRAEAALSPKVLRKSRLFIFFLAVSYWLYKLCGFLLSGSSHCFRGCFSSMRAIQLYGSIAKFIEISSTYYDAVLRDKRQNQNSLPVVLIIVGKNGIFWRIDPTN
jgi:hypothetical protein